MTKLLTTRHKRDFFKFNIKDNLVLCQPGYCDLFSVSNAEVYIWISRAVLRIVPVVVVFTVLAHCLNGSILIVDSSDGASAGR